MPRSGKTGFRSHGRTVEGVPTLSVLSAFRSLSAKLLVLPLALTAIGVIATGIVANRMLTDNAERETHEKAAMLLGTHQAMAQHFATTVAPKVADSGDGGTEGTASRAARDAMERYQQDFREFPYRYRLVSANPTNPKNQADEYEAKLIATFDADHSLQRLEDHVSNDSGSYTVMAAPITANENRCMTCHSTPAVAPASRVRHWGKTAGFGWKKDQVVGASVVYVPTATSKAAAGTLYRTLLTILLPFIGLSCGWMVWRTYTMVARPANEMIEQSRAIRHGQWTSRFLTTGSDELSTLAASFQETTRWLRERVAQEEKLRAMFQQFVPASVAAKALGRDASAIIEGDQQVVTVMVINIRNFRLLMEHLPPQDTVTTLNEFFSQVNQAIVDNNGLVSKYLGDSVLAFFGMPLRTQTHSLDAIKAALAIPQNLQDMYIRLDEQFGWQLGVGVGIATGEPIVGHFGSSEHYEYTVLGEVVRNAHNLEEISKGIPEEDTIVIDETTYRDVMSEVHVFDMGTRKTAAGHELHAFVVQGMRMEAREVISA